MNGKNLFGKAPNSMRTIIIVGAILLVVIAGLFLVIGAALGLMLFSTYTKSSVTPVALLILAIVLLVFILILLLLLFRCSCGGEKNRFPVDFLRFLPILPQIPPAIRTTAIALKEAGYALDIIKTNLNAVQNMTTINIDPHAAPSPLDVLIKCGEIVEGVNSNIANHLRENITNIDTENVIQRLNNAADILGGISVALGEQPLPQIPQP